MTSVFEAIAKIFLKTNRTKNGISILLISNNNLNLFISDYLKHKEELAMLCPFLMYDKTLLFLLPDKLWDKNLVFLSFS